MSKYSDTRYFNEISKLKVKCPCGHSQTVFNDKTICRWCGRMVYRNKKMEFKERLIEKLRRVNNYEL